MATTSSTPSKLQTIESIILMALKGLQMIPPISGAASLIGVFADILVKAQAAYAAEAGTPLDLSKIPLETPYSTPPVAVGPAPAPPGA